MKSALSLLVALVSLPAFAGNMAEMKVTCSAEGDFGKDGKIVYEMSATETLESKEGEGMAWHFHPQLIVNIKKMEVNSDVFVPYLENGTLAVVSAEEGAEFHSYSVPESATGLFIDFSMKDHSFTLRHALTAKKEIRATGSCLIEEKIIEEEKEPVDEGDGQQQQQEPVEGEEGDGQQQQQEPVEEEKDGEGQQEQK